jgi:hypothetical protein
MNATVKCSQCGAEITNLNLSAGRRPWLILIMVAVLLFVVYPEWRLWRPKGDFRKDLEVTVLETKWDQDVGVVVLGTIQNKGNTTWSSITLAANFFSADGKFLDQQTDHAFISLAPGGKEHFKIMTRLGPARVKRDDVRIEVKVTDAMSKLL